MLLGLEEGLRGRFLCLWGVLTKRIWRRKHGMAFLFFSLNSEVISLLSHAVPSAAI